MATCKDCIDYAKCLRLGDLDALSLTEGVEACAGFVPVKVCIDLVSHLGETVYKICPKCNPNHNESCERCAWHGCLSQVGCDVYGLWSNGEYSADKCTIVPKKLYWNFIPTIAKELGNRAFLNRDDAVRKLEALKSLEKGE